jgi:D-cysteine desulfhydrase family pyridoxal phosphate-dependent enzyme
MAHLPTVIEPLPNLSAVLGGPQIFIKRDDQTGVALGGNKVRKLEFVLAEALANGAKTLITVGAAQSNHCRQTAALAARLGLRCILVLSGQPPQLADGNFLLDQLFGAEVVWTTRAEREQVLQRVFEQAWEEGARPYLIPLGASTPIGTLGYAKAFEEFLMQGMPMDRMVVASSSGGTQAGLVLGSKRAGWAGQVIGISIDHARLELAEKVAELANQAAERLGEQIPCITAQDVWVEDDFLGAGYGVLGAQEIEAIRLFAKYEGVLLDPVYTGRAAAGLIGMIRAGAFRRSENILFWHTGGTPALFASLYAAQLQG